MTNREYFLKAAELWRNATPWNQWPHVVIESDVKEIAFGVCDTIYFLLRANKEEYKWIDIKLLMREYKEGNSLADYWWPKTAEGAKCRVKFCEKMAAICEEE